MKTEELLELGLTKEQADKVFALNGKDVEGAKAKFADYDTIKTQLGEANTKLEGFDPEWKSKVEQAERERDTKISDMEFQNLLTSAITGAKGRSTKAVMALLDVDALKASKNQETDIKAALEGLKKESGFLFETVTPTKTGMTHQGATEEVPNKNDEANAAIRAAFGKEN